MAILPQGSVLNTTQTSPQQQTSRTYAIDPMTKRIVGMVDGIEAVKQAVMLILGTERFKHSIFSANYGSELEELTGADSTSFSAEIGRRIRDALIHDDRISDVQDFRITMSGDTALVEFTVVSVYGDFTAEKVVNKSV